jgi:hypothetical protein
VTQEAGLKINRITGGYSMRKHALAALLSALLLLSATGLLVGCAKNDEQTQTPSETVQIEAFKMTSGNVEFTNYVITLQQTPEEWNALSTQEQENLAQAGFASAVEQIRTNEASNYNIQGMTATTDSAGTRIDSQVAYRLDLENSALLLFSITDDSGAPTTVAEIAVELP